MACCDDDAERPFDAQTTPNCYNGRKTRRFNTPARVTFTTADPVKLPLPSSDLLASLAACAQVAHLSGAGEYVDRILEDMEQIDVSARDGTLSGVLHNSRFPRKVVFH